VIGKLVRRRHLSAEEFTYLRGRTGRVAKVTLPSPSLLANFWSSELSRDFYPTLDDFLVDVTEILRQEVLELERLGCRYIQLDAPHYPLLIDEGTRRFYEGQGWSLDAWLGRGIELDNTLIDATDKITFGFHLCRGNQGNRYLVSGGYEPIAQKIFQGVHADRLLLEYDDERSGDFQPLQHVPDDKMVVLGIMTTKSPRLEAKSDLERRVREAAKVIDLEQLAISPQCGFSTSIVGNDLNSDDQAAKLQRLAETAAEIWN
jgi:5-methyltetrahydropteroyltriglutamate--homocysteine methyltransferase